MSEPATVKTCPGGEKCHSYSESLPEGWFEGTDYLGGPDYGVQYCAEHHAELLPGGEVVPMVPLEQAVDALIAAVQECPAYTDGDCLRGCNTPEGSDACREALRKHLTLRRKRP